MLSQEQMDVLGERRWSDDAANARYRKARHGTYWTMADKTPTSTAILLRAIYGVTAKNAMKPWARNLHFRGAFNFLKDYHKASWNALKRNARGREEGHGCRLPFRNRSWIPTPP